MRRDEIDPATLALIGVAGVFVTACLVASFRGVGVGWFGIFAGWALAIVMTAGVSAIAAAVVIGACYVVFGMWFPKLVTKVKVTEQAPLILPTVLTALSASLVSTCDGVLANRPVLRWAICVGTAALTLFGTILVSLDIKAAVNVAAVVALIVPVGVLAYAAFTTNWRASLARLSPTDRVLVVGGLSAWAGALGCSILLAKHRAGGPRREPASARTLPSPRSG